MASKSSSTAARLPARDRLLAAADALFYDEGFATVGIDRVIESAGVAKASLYDCFGSKEELVRSYLQARQESRRARLEAHLLKYAGPRARLLGVFDLLVKSVKDPGFRGCPFMRANADAKPGSSVSLQCEASRKWMRDLIARLAREAGAAEPSRLAKRLVILYDGALVSAHMDHDPDAARTARTLAAALLDDAVDGKSSGSE